MKPFYETVLFGYDYIVFRDGIVEYKCVQVYGI
jgi:hypothetical protein